MHRKIFLSMLMASVISVLPAAPPPDLMNYQGVLRDSGGAPLAGSYDMVFRFFTALSGGDEVLIDRHVAANLQAVTVSDGLFNVSLGSGQVLDGSGPGSYTTLSDAFASHSGLWLELQIGSETLSPRVRVAASGYALNSQLIDGRPASAFIDTSSLTQTKAGKLVLGPSNEYGIEARGNWGGGYFKHLVSNSWATVAEGNYGIQARGPLGGAYFQDLDSSGYAEVGISDVGIRGYGNTVGGSFFDLNSSGAARVADGDRGITASGDFSGGRFEDSDGTGYAEVGSGDIGIQAYGNVAGGQFTDLTGSGYALIAYIDTGIYGYGDDMGGYFVDTNSSGYAEVANGDYGIRAYGNLAGGRFEDLTGSGLALAGNGDFGIQGYGNYTGGYFLDLDSNSYGRVGYSIYKIFGSGTVSFAQNHPDETDKVVVYHAPESSEVAVYTRGSAQLEGGVARIDLDETFQWVANPDLGLTAHLTPRGVAVPLAVESLTTTALVVRGPAGSDATLDYMVWGLRIGFEEAAPVQPKEQESYIPSMDEHRALYRQDESLRRFSARERFLEIEARARDVDPAELDLSRSAKLVAQVGEYDRQRHGAVVVDDAKPEFEAVTPAAEAQAMVGIERSGVDPRTSVLDDTVWIEVTADVEEGDLLSLAVDRPGTLQRAATMADPHVVGIAAGALRRLDDGTLQAPLADGRYATLKVDAGYGAIQPGDLLVSSPTAGHAMRTLEVVPGTVIGKAIDPLEVGVGTIRVMLLTR